ncbi:protein of unknown function [Rhodovastum atsumiense]|nr:protein of unknown function [Rhodovastum atsumiense]
MEALREGKQVNFAFRVWLKFDATLLFI